MCYKNSYVTDWNVHLDKKGFEMSIAYKYIHDDDWITKK